MAFQKRSVTLAGQGRPYGVNRAFAPLVVSAPVNGWVQNFSDRNDVEQLATPSGLGAIVKDGQFGRGVGYSALTTDAWRLHSLPNSVDVNNVWNVPSRQVTVMVAFVRFGNNPNGTAPIFMLGSPANAPYNRYGIVDSAGSGTLVFSASPGGNYQSVSDSAAVSNNTLVVAFGVYDGASMSVWRSGVKQATAAASGLLTSPIAPDTYPSIGNYGLYTGAARSFNGVVYVASLWDRALSDREIVWLSKRPFDVLRAMRRASYSGGLLLPILSSVTYTPGTLTSSGYGVRVTAA